MSNDKQYTGGNSDWWVILILPFLEKVWET